MSASTKLEEANFFLKKLRVLQTLPQDKDTQNKSHYYLSAFLSAARSVFDHLLEDYNIKFSLNIPLTERKMAKTFKEEAKKTNNKCALSFIEWWYKKRESLTNDPVGKLLINKRNIGIHKVQVKPDLAKITATDSITATDIIAELDKNDNIEEIIKSDLAKNTAEDTIEQLPLTPKETEITFDWFFSEYPDKPMMSVCEKILNMLTALVSEAEQKFA